ncbi:ABC transporter ATP-binding protein [Microcella sp.]|uniref:ABC transporter ATP-binding protein n=1 Tax=Microcella sp. TaxID=1913979 RepID=UPI002567A03C|nr:ABC transporter ATP-binding protein [Microcella sp.]MBX9472392.1 ABC transporter ATP-binding protein [Microcella sp.]
MPLEINNVTVSYGPITAVRGVSLVVKPGEIISVIGPNGAGKTSLMSAILGLISHGGDVVVDGTRCTHSSSHVRARRGISFVPDARGVFPELTVREQVLLGTKKSDKGVYDELAESFPLLADFADREGGSLSGGQKQLVSMARAIAARPRYLLMDEPSIGLSPVAIRGVIDVVRRLGHMGIGVLMTEQNVKIAMTESSEVHVMVRGGVELSGTPSALQDDPLIEDLYLGRSAH